MSTSIRNRAASQRLEGTVWSAVPIAAWGYRALLTLGARLARAGVSADLLTALSLVLALFSGIALAFGAAWLALVAVLASGLLDALDGIVARASGTSSRAGALLDSVVDRVSDAAPLTGVVVLAARGDPPELAAIPAVAMLGGFTVSYVRARSEALGAVLPPLYARRAERVVAVALSIALGAIVGLEGSGLMVLLAGVAVIGVLSLVAAVHALIVARSLLSPALHAVPEPLPVRQDDVPPSKRAA